MVTFPSVEVLTYEKIKYLNIYPEKWWQTYPIREECEKMGVLAPHADVSRQECSL